MMITDSTISEGDQLGAQMASLASLIHIGEMTGQEVVVFNEVRHAGRGMRFLLFFDLPFTVFSRDRTGFSDWCFRTLGWNYSHQTIMKRLIERRLFHRAMESFFVVATRVLYRLVRFILYREYKPLRVADFSQMIEGAKKLLVIGASGLIGSEMCVHFAGLEWDVHGIDNNQRAVFFGPSGDTRWNQRRLETTLKHYTHHELDMRDREGVLRLMPEIRPDAIVPTAAQIPFVHLSTNKVYGDAAYLNGIPETFRIDQTKHSLFGASKVSGDISVQEYGRYFNMPTACLRGGCLTGPNHSGVELHGFLSYLIKCNLEQREYTVFGYKGKQVRDNIHAYDVACFIEAFLKAPRVAEVYNIGGGKGNSCSILEAFDLISRISGIPMKWVYKNENRIGDHICYYSDLPKMKAHYPAWGITKSLDDTFLEIYAAWRLKQD